MQSSMRCLLGDIRKASLSKQRHDSDKVSVHEDAGEPEKRKHNFKKQISHLISLIDPQFQMRRGESMGRYGETVHMSFIYKPLIYCNQFWWFISLYFRAI